MTHGGAEAEIYTFLAVDPNPEGSQPTSPGPIDPCVQVSVGSTFDVDIQIRAVVNLQSWEAYFTYDTAALEITARNVKLFQAADPASSILDGSEPLPDDGLNGGYQLAASDIGFSADSGSGVLARVTMRAKAPGLMTASLPQIDRNGDGTPELGVILEDNAGNKIGDLNGDGFFDGTAYSALIAIDVPCPASTPVPSPPPLPWDPPPTGTPAPTPTPEPTSDTLPKPTSRPPSPAKTPGGAVGAGTPPSGSAPRSPGSSTSAPGIIRITEDSEPAPRSAPVSGSPGAGGDGDGDGGGAAGRRGSSGEPAEGGGSSGVDALLVTLISLATITIGATMAGGFALYNRSRSRDPL